MARTVVGRPVPDVRDAGERPGVDAPVQGRDLEHWEHVGPGGFTVEDGLRKPHGGIVGACTVRGYFTSEPGVTRALRYNPVPGRFEGCVAYRPGERAWA